MLGRNAFWCLEERSARLLSSLRAMLYAALPPRLCAAQELWCRVVTRIDSNSRAFNMTPSPKMQPLQAKGLVTGFFNLCCTTTHIQAPTFCLLLRAVAEADER